MVKVVPSSPIWKNQKAKKTAEVLERLEGHSREEEAAKQASDIGLPYIDLQVFPTSQEDLILIREEDARKHRLAIFERTGRRVRIAIADPSDSKANQFIEEQAKKNDWEVERYVVSTQSLERVWSFYKNATMLESLDLWRVSLQGDDLKKFEENFSDLLKLRESSNVPISQTIEIILAGANKLRASDIHIEPTEEATRLRYRIDGMLQDIGVLSKDVYRLTLSRVKMLSHMKINVRDRAQDGHFSVELDKKKIDLRVNIIPGNHGENINMRILNSENVLLDMEVLGIHGETLEKITHEMNRPHGMILNTGPTGSGKTTTLYSILHTINKPDVKIITVEDPIEYQIPGIVQTEVSKDRSYTFGTALRAIVRQDPDVILVGEIRDEETADVAVNAALTGHLLLSTVHANTAPGAIPRLIEMGVKPSLIASSINIIIGQRLVRKLCEHCKESYAPANETIENFKRILSLVSPKAKVDIPSKIDTLWRAKGCSECNFTGYRGRIGVFETFSVTKEIEEIILELGTEKEIARAALEAGMVTMMQDGVLKSLRGETTMEEVWRATGQKDFLDEIYESLSKNSLAKSKSSISNEFFESVRNAVKDSGSFSEFLLGLPIEKVAPAILAGAVAARADEIHIEPDESRVLVRFKRNGILEPSAEIGAENFLSLVGEIKLISGMEATQKSGIRDGRFSLTLEGDDQQEIDARISIALGGYGETIMIKIMGDKAEMAFDELGLRKEQSEKILSICKHPFGMVVASGPDGSGKTTLLYSLLLKLRTPEMKIMTVEDPIERRIQGVLQTQVNESEGYTAPEAIRSLLRQNPDLLLVSELRNAESTEAAVEAALTGHFILSSMQSSSAALSVTRFCGFGMGGRDLMNASVSFVGSRLVRKLCEHCRKKRDLSTSEQSEILDILSGITAIPKESIGKESIAFDANGCEHCGNTGYDGQIMLCEIIPATKTLADAIDGSGTVEDIEDAAQKDGMLSILEDGMLAVVEGKTTLEEIRRVTEK